MNHKFIHLNEIEFRQLPSNEFLLVNDIRLKVELFPSVACPPACCWQTFKWRSSTLIERKSLLIAFVHFVHRITSVSRSSLTESRQWTPESSARCVEAESWSSVFCLCSSSSRLSSFCLRSWRCGLPTSRSQSHLNHDLRQMHLRREMFNRLHRNSRFLDLTRSQPSLRMLLMKIMVQKEQADDQSMFHLLKFNIFHLSVLYLVMFLFKKCSRIWIHLAVLPRSWKWNSGSEKIIINRLWKIKEHSYSPIDYYQPHRNSNICIITECKSDSHLDYIAKDSSFIYRR